MSSIPTIFDSRRKLAAEQRAAYLAARHGADDFIIEDMVEDVIERIDFMQLDAGRALTIGADRCDLATRLARLGWDVSAPPAPVFDDEQPWGDGFDLVVSLGRLDRVNDLPGALIHMRGALAKGGIAIASFTGAGSLAQLRAAMLAADGERPAARLHPMVDSAAASGLMQRAGFARQVVDSHTLEVRYGSLDRLAHDLRAHGFANQLASTPPPLTRGGWGRARRCFKEAAGQGGKTAERFEILTLTGWR